MDSNVEQLIIGSGPVHLAAYGMRSKKNIATQSFSDFFSSGEDYSSIES